MSHIDSFRHSIVGSFAGLPVYLPLQHIDGDFKCTPGQLLIGGGSGEHPALVLQNPLAAVAWFLDEICDIELEEVVCSNWESVYKSHIIFDCNKILKFNDWKVKDYYHFFRRCCSNYLPNSYTIYEDRMSVEQWLILGFGEFIFYSMPELAQEIMSNLHDPYQYFTHIYFNNILLIPPNMPVYANGGNAFYSERVKISD